MADTIFVQIASYRDPELKKTLKDLIDNANHPENLRICIAWQHHPDDEWDELDEYKDDSRFKIIDISSKDSKGVCWARNKVQQEYSGEKYTLQLDSHHRFIEGWDSKLVGMIEDLQADGYNKPLLTGYIPSYNPDNDPQERVQVPWRMVFDRFIPEGPVFFLPEAIPEFEKLDKPVPARFYSAHFCFTLGQFCIDVPHNPKFYFHGEEISISVRAYTHGYDLFHPHVVIAWHEYTRQDREKHWDNHHDWYIQNTYTHQQTKELLGIDQDPVWDAEYGFGQERDLVDYENYAGIEFKTRGVQQYTIEGKYPPNPTKEEFGEEEWENRFCKTFKHCIDVNPLNVPLDDYDFWAITFHDEQGTEIHRQDADIGELASIGVYGDEERDIYHIWRTFETAITPTYWTVLPHSMSSGWCERVQGRLD